MHNRLCLVTGANSGIGKAVARHLAAMHAYVIMLCRNEQKAEQARKEIADSTGNTGVEVVIADLAHPYDIRAAAETLNRRFDKLDLLVNNAGIYPAGRTETVEGIEQTFAINHLGPFLLTNLLTGLLGKSDHARVVTVASNAHKAATAYFDLQNLQLNRGYTPMKAYCLSKLCNIMFTHELAKRTADSRITANALHPGAVRSGLADDGSWGMKLLFTLGKPFLRSPRKGAETVLYLAVSRDVASVTGKYFKDKKRIDPAPIACDDRLTQQLWDQSAELTGL